MIISIEPAWRTRIGNANKIKGFDHERQAYSVGGRILRYLSLAIDCAFSALVIPEAGA